MIKKEVIIIGGGPAGLAAAIACFDAGTTDILVLERDKDLGGILQQCIHHGFGLHTFNEELTGPEYAQRYIDRLYARGIEVKLDTMVLSVSADKKVTCINTIDGLVTYEAGAVILAMGCRERTRGALNIPGFRPAGVFTAGCAQRIVNMEGYMPGKEVVILGSGDIGLIMARRMTWEGAKVKMVCEIMPYSSGLTRNIVQCLEDNGIPLRFNYTVAKIHGKERVEGVTVARVDENRQPIPETFEFIPCDTLLLSVGLIPENELTEEAGITIDPRTKGAIVDQYRQTSVPGIFACGNVLQVHDLVDNVSQEAAVAGAAAAAYIQGKGAFEGEIVQVIPEQGASYSVPQKIRKGETKDIDIYYRVRSAYRPAKVEVLSGDKLLFSRKKQVMTPGEMEKVTLPAARFGEAGETLVLRVTEG